MSSRSSARLSNSLDGARELVVQLGQLLLLQLLDGRLERLAVAVGNLLRLACRHADQTRFDLGDQPLGAELDHVVALTLAVVHEIDDDRVAFARRPVLGGDERGGGVAQQLELLIDHLLGDVGLCARHLQRRPVGHLGLGLDVDGGREAKRLVARLGQLVVVLGLRDRANVVADGGVAEPAADVAVHCLGVQALLADPREQHLHRHLALAEARDLQAGGEIGGRVVDRVLDVAAGYLDPRRTRFSGSSSTTVCTRPI